MLVRERADHTVFAGAAARDSERAPLAFREAVELWARGTGRHASLDWNHDTKCYCVGITLKPGHPLLGMYQAGLLPREPKELVMLRYETRPGVFEATDLEALGPSGLTTLLEQADLMSQRGERRGLQGAISAVEQHNKNLRDTMRKEAMDRMVEEGKYRKAQIFGNPSVAVAANINGDTTV